MINFFELFTCKDTELYQNVKDQKKYMVTDTLKVLVNQDSEIMIMIGQLCYGITQQTHAGYYLYQNKNGNFVIIDLENSLHGSYQIVVKENADILLPCFEQKCMVEDKGQKKNGKLQPAKMTPGGPSNKEKDMKGSGSSSSSKGSEQKKQSAMVEVSKSLGKGIYMTAKMLAGGITTISDKVADKIQPAQQEVKINQTAKKGLKGVCNVTGQIHKISSGTAQKVIEYGRGVAYNTVKSNESAQKVQKSKSFSYVKDGVLDIIKVVLNVYDGVMEGGDELKNGALSGTQKIVKKKYGLQAEDAVKDVIGGIDNVYKIYKLPKTEAKRIFKIEGVMKDSSIKGQGRFMGKY